MGLEVTSEDPDELIRIAVRLWGRIKESKDKTRTLEMELAKIEDKIALKMPGNREAASA
jgi:hypothetical protein